MHKCSVCGIGHNSGSICPSEKYKDQFICVNCCSKCKYWQRDKHVHIWCCHLRVLKTKKAKPAPVAQPDEDNYNFFVAESKSESDRSYGR